MNDKQDNAAVPPTLRSSGAASFVMRECLRIQALAPPQGEYARLFGQNPVAPEARSWFREAVGEIESISKGRTRRKDTMLPHGAYRWLKRRPLILSEQAIALYSTADDMPGLVERFQRLQQEVALARRQFRAWAAVIVLMPIGVAAALLAVLPGVITTSLSL